MMMIVGSQGCSSHSQFASHPQGDAIRPISSTVRIDRRIPHPPTSRFVSHFESNRFNLLNDETRETETIFIEIRESLSNLTRHHRDKSRAFRLLSQIRFQDQPLNRFRPSIISVIQPDYAKQCKTVTNQSGVDPRCR